MLSHWKGMVHKDGGLNSGLSSSGRVIFLWGHDNTLRSSPQLGACVYRDHPQKNYYTGSYFHYIFRSFVHDMAC